MRNTRTLSIAVLAVASLSAGATSASALGAATAPAATTQSDQSSEAQKAYDRIVAKLPSDWQAKQKAFFAKTGIERSPAQEIALAKIQKAAKAKKAGQRAINPDDYQCAPTKLDAYVDSILEDVDPTTLFLLQLMGGLDIPTYDALLFGKQNDPQFPLPASDAASLKSTFGTSQRFWDVKLNDVKLMGMDGSAFSDVNRVTRVVQVLYGVGPADATDIARDIITIVKSDAALENGNNPIFTLNAFAFSAEGETDPVIRKVSDRVVYGDGINKALKAVGLNKVGPKAVLSHEMAHHVQYENNSFGDDQGTPEGTRRTELMADAFATYFGTHKKGLGLNPSQILKFQDSFYTVGDCSYTSNGHHGTPNQRRAAASWGAANVAFGDPVKVIKSKNLENKFNKVLPQLLEPDAPTSINAYRNKIAVAQ